MTVPTYIPILKWQACEMKALLGLYPDIQRAVLPCIEVREPRFHANFIQTYLKNWNRPALFDYSNPQGLLTSVRQSQFVETIVQSRKLGLPLLPVINPADSICTLKNPFLENILSDGRVFLRPRVKLDDLKSSLIRLLLPVTARCRAANIKVGILLDLGCTPTLSGSHRAQLGALVRELSLQPIDELYLASGAYPGTLKKIGQGVGQVPREDWLLWRGIFEEDLLGKLSLGYSDYASVCPTWSEEIKMQRGPFAIRYAIDDKWLIVRGGSDTTREEAVNLSKIFFKVYGSFVESKDFSIGDRNLYNKSDDGVPMRYKLCSAADHVWEALDHHITYVVRRQYPSD